MNEVNDKEKWFRMITFGPQNATDHDPKKISKSDGIWTKWVDEEVLAFDFFLLKKIIMDWSCFRGLIN